MIVTSLPKSGAVVVTTKPVYEWDSLRKYLMYKNAFRNKRKYIC